MKTEVKKYYEKGCKKYCEDGGSLQLKIQGFATTSVNCNDIQPLSLNNSTKLTRNSSLSKDDANFVDTLKTKQKKPPLSTTNTTCQQHRKFP